MQIDSLNRANAQLRQEKREIMTKYQETARTLNQVSQQKQDLSEKLHLLQNWMQTNIKDTGNKQQRWAVQKI